MRRKGLVTKRVAIPMLTALLIFNGILAFNGCGKLSENEMINALSESDGVVITVEENANEKEFKMPERVQVIDSTEQKEENSTEQEQDKVTENTEQAEENSEQTEEVEQSTESLSESETNEVEQPQEVSEEQLIENEVGENGSESSGVVLTEEQVQVFIEEQEVEPQPQPQQEEVQQEAQQEVQQPQQQTQNNFDRADLDEIMLGLGASIGRGDMAVGGEATHEGNYSGSWVE